MLYNKIMNNGRNMNRAERRIMEKELEKMMEALYTELAMDTENNDEEVEAFEFENEEVETVKEEKGFFKTAINIAGRGVKAVINGVKNTGTIVVESTKAIGITIANGVKNVANLAVKGVKAVGTTIAKGVKAVGNFIKGIFGGIFGMFKKQKEEDIETVETVNEDR